MIKRISLGLLCLMVFMAPSSQLFEQEKRLDVPYVPTKYPVVDEMLRLTNVQKSDIVYDLGCGDGRIVIAACQRYGARGVGIDIDPDRINESKENAAKAGVQDKVQFLLQDLFKTDFHEATVMTLYLLPSVNIRLRPKILRELRPGSRVVSHNFTMDNWKPDQSSVVTVDEVNHDVYMWIIPANVTGTWKWTIPTNKGSLNCEMVVEQHFQWPAATIAVSGVSASVKDLSLQGDRLHFVLEPVTAGKFPPMTFEGRVFNHTITGAIKTGKKDETWEWKATRDPLTEKPLDAESEKSSLFVN